jgi:hypothetical protein
VIELPGKLLSEKNRVYGKRVRPFEMIEHSLVDQGLEQGLIAYMRKPTFGFADFNLDEDSQPYQHYAQYGNGYVRLVNNSQPHRRSSSSYHTNVALNTFIGKSECPV